MCEATTLLAEIGALGDELSLAIEAGDAPRAIATTMQLRRSRLELGRAPRPATSAETMRLVAGARAAEAMMSRWLARPVGGDTTLLGSGIGIAALADLILPPVWDFETDLVILDGEALAPVAELLAELGQRRIILVGAERASSGAICAATPEEVAFAIRSLVPVPPAQLVVRGLADVSKLGEVARGALADVRIHRNTVRAFSRTWIDQGAANLPAIGACPSVAALDGAFRGVPMVIAAPGPSLAKNIEQLRALHGRAIVTAFSHSLKAVLAAGVTPDFVVTVDPQDVRYHFAGCDLSRTCLVNAATAHPSLYELPAARFLTLSANCAIDDWIFDGLGEEAMVAGGGSVATSAFSLALRWGCDPIAFVGLDLSFPGGAYYVSSSSDGACRATVDGGVVRVDGWSAGFHAMKSIGGPALSSERAIELPGWAGGTVPSSFMFGLFHRWFVDRMKSVTARVYNCTEGGAYIAGMEHVRLADVVFDGTVDVAAALDAVACDRERRTEKLARRASTFVARLRRCRGLATRARALIARGDTGPRLARLERALVRALQPLGFASLVAQRELEAAHEAARRDRTTDEYLAASARLLAALGEVTEQLEPVFAAAHTRLSGGLHERA